MNEIKPLEEVDPELAEYFRLIANGKMRARIDGTRVFQDMGGWEQEIIVSENIGRNDPCICGSGKKFKKCCGQSK
ncbi:MAG: SEC-C metal-binding domain-containing protein [Nitrosarchaeum sp.]|nr:SEC-C metal-binding domain-containing protein [Nitrosarchaeum sp.]